MMWCGAISPREYVTSSSEEEEGEEEIDSAATQCAPSPSVPAVAMPATAISEPIVVHVDIDYFFAQVEELRLGLRDRPLGVQQNMEVASVNYVAREFGLYNRISVTKAKRMCPGLVLVRGDNGVNGMQRYRAASQGVLRCVMGALDELQRSPTIGPSGSASRRRLMIFTCDCSGWVTDRMAPLWPGQDGCGTGLRRSLGCSARWGWGGRSFWLRWQPRGPRGSVPPPAAAVALFLTPRQAQTRALATDAITNAGTSRIHLCRARRGSSGRHHAGSGPRNCRGESCASASELSPSERELLYAARVADLKGAGLHGVSPATRRAVLGALGECATLGTVLAWLNRNQDKGAAVKCLDSHGVAALRKLLYTGCDGSAIRYFQPP